MVRLRQAKPSDVPALLDMARTGNFINLPPYRDRLEEMVGISDASFKRVESLRDPPPDHDRTHDNYMFVVEAPTGECLGTSAIRGGMIARDHPNLSYQLIKLVRESALLSKSVHGHERPEDATSRTIVSGRMEHVYAYLFQDTGYPTELGGNVLRHDTRGQGLGKLASYARFHYLRAHAPWFSDRLLAEMMAPVDGYNDGTPFWRHVIRKYINMTYDDADRLSTQADKREFMYELLPKFVNLSLLDDIVLDSIGRISDATRPAAEMLHDIGFRETNRIDPFDAGPHLEMRLSELRALACERRECVTGCDPRSATTVDALVSVENEEHGFVAIRTRAEVVLGAPVRLTDEAAEALGVSAGDAVMVSLLKFSPDRRPRDPMPKINLRDELKKRREQLTGRRLAALPFADVAAIVQERVEEIRAALDRPATP